MNLEINGDNKLHPDIARSLGNLGLAYEGLGKLDSALEKHEQTLEIFQAI